MGMGMGMGMGDSGFVARQCSAEGFMGVDVVKAANRRRKTPARDPYRTLNGDW
jgi:hypothetical protein